MSARIASDFNMVNPLFTMRRYRAPMAGVPTQLRLEKLLVYAISMAIVAIGVLFAQPAYAQSSTYSNTTTGTIDGSTVCTSPLVRNISVADSYTISDVNIGILATHTWRGDLQFTLESPNGTRVQLTNGDINNTSGNNFNVLLDDAAAQLVNTDSATGAHGTTAPPYENTFRPDNALSAFNGENSAGTWRLEICDLFPSADNGTFVRADLVLTTTPTNYADLSLTKTLIGSPPVQGGTASWRLTVTNASTSTDTATGVVVDDTLPGSFTFSSSSGDGSFNAASGTWTVGSLAPGESKSLTIQGTVSSTAGSTVTNTAEIVASSITDIDSTVNNGVTSEDDYASSSFTVQSGRAPGIPPLLSCPAGFSVFDWDTIPGWTAGSTDNTYAFDSFGNIRFQLTNDGVYQNNAAFGGQNPTVFNFFTGALNPVEDSLTVVADQPNQAGEVVITVTLPRSFTGVQFTIFDVDFGTNQFADRVEVSGTNGGSSVLPTMTNGNVNYVSGSNVIIGDGASGSAEALGNVVVTFTQAVDTIEIRYGNHTTAPNNPGQQGIGLHDITVCDPFTTLSVSKISSIISDPVNGSTNPKAIPGAVVEYLITVTNTGSEAVDADSVSVWDDGPADAKMCLISRAGGPVIFNDPGGNTGLNYSFSALGSTTDDVEFSENNGTNWNLAPVDDGGGCDTRITDFRVNPTGAFAGGTTFTLTVRFEIE